MVHEKLPKRVAAGARKPKENRFRDSFSIGGASRRAGVEKTLATLRSEPPRILIYGVLSRQNATFQLFALATKTLEKASPELPVGSPNAFIFNES